ncbi:hypothetical protein E4P34_00965 [Kocuria rhizophila]|uniref:KAP NTPase domain-containing protein n=1 Tax=Kocuria rhizophila TaxID=72000 RepID=A0AAX2SCX6_KOCRH|nr:KAP family NTPase [Kocuria rhizophila]TFH99864.1 hypothetical protein E4P33_10015 [Kocuria rhizophila]TFI11690.1 hypothetical protein E4P34_00965 [Kocuria rhizophila]
MTAMSWTDEALLTGAQDGLGRLPYARQAAELIQTTHSFESSAVFGLSGPWGSGKTSLVNMIVEALEEMENPRWAVARFTPWATSDVPGLLAEFYSALAEVLPKKKGKQVRRALAVTATVAAPAANLIPFVGTMAAEGARIAGEELAKSPSWQAAFNKASEKLKGLKKPILVIVDDIDRLHGDELLTLLKVVRLLGRFDGVQYLLAYDDETLYRRMSTSSTITDHDGSAERFMEKIVQYPLFVPPLLRHQQISRLNAGLACASREKTEEASDDGRLSELLDCFTALLTTPRAIDRYIAQLQHHIPLIPSNEVDDVDMQLLTLIRVSFPSLFNSIPRYRRELTSGHTGEIKFSSRSLEYEPFDIEPLLKVVPAGNRGVARKLLVSLFPRVRQKNQISAHGSRRRQSVQYEEYFDRYFAMGILDHDVSDAAVGAAVKSATTGEPAQLTAFLVNAPKEKRALILSKCLNPTNQPTTDGGRIHLARTLAGITNSLPPEDHVPFSDRDQILSWVGDLLIKLDGSMPPSKVRNLIWELQDSPLRIRAWKRLEASMDNAQRPERPSWYNDITSLLVRDAADDFLRHLKEGDGAEVRSGLGYQAYFVLDHNGQALRAPIHQMLNSGTTSLATLASRLVSIQTHVGTKPSWQLSPEFDQAAFDQLAPGDDDPWYHEPVQNVDLRDLSWANRRKFATGRVNQPR